MDVSIRLPLAIDIDVLQIEDRYPSIEFDVRIEGRAPGRLCFHDTIWVEQSVWSVFIDTLQTSTFVSLRDDAGEIAFDDLGAAFRFGLRGEEKAVFLRVSAQRQRRFGSITFEVVERIDDLVFGHIQRAFAQCLIR